MSRGCLVSIAVLILLVVGGVVVDLVVPSKAIARLPKSATNEQEYYQGVIDYVRSVKASLPPEDYEEYAKSMGFKTRFSERDPNRMYANLGHGDAPEWWDPPRADETTYFEYDAGWTRFLKYKEGVVYYMDCSW